MSEPVIRVEGVGKQFHIGRLRNRRLSLQEVAKNTLLSPVRKAARLLAGQPAELEETIWALRDVNFEVHRGEAVGIIGRNGAGKSTLLKILSRIIAPTTGSIEIHGRLGALLEVGTGFHPELTGRDNVYLSGAILGMKRAEIRARFDEIVDFAEIERFIDTPVKHYSSGMYLRLAFAVAAHLEPDILVMDEVLAVGDARFQKKCLGKMQDVGKQGRTVLFVSHSMPAVTRLCPRAILLEDTRILMDGPAHSVVGSYLSSGLGITASKEWTDPATAPQNDIARMWAIRVHNEDGAVCDAFDIRQPIGITIEWEALQDGHVMGPNLGLENEEGFLVFQAIDLDPAWRRKPRPIGRYSSTAWIPANLLTEGTLRLGVSIITESPFITHLDAPLAAAFQVIDSMDGNSARGDYGGMMAGAVRPLLKWTTQYTPQGAEFALDTAAKAETMGN